MKKEVALFMSALAVLGMTACGSKTQAGQAESDSVSVANSDTVAAVVEEDPVNVDVVKGELGLFELQGPVKSCTVKNQYGAVARTFDENGMWLTYEGKTLKEVYPSGIKRDKEGRIVAGMTDADGNGEEYAYNGDGKITKYNYHEFDSVEEDTYTYDADGNLQKKRVEEGGMDAGEPYTETYEVLATDEHGNWTKRKVKIGGSVADTQTRTITYYE